jgi:hypothetical protein
MQILIAAKREVDEVWQAFSTASSIDPRSQLGRLIQVVKSEHHGVVPRFAGNERLLNTRIDPTLPTVEAISRRLHATPNSLAPFLILLAYETAANADPLREFERDCLHDDVIFKDRAIVVWGKRRSSREQRVSRDKRGRYSAPALITKIKALTAPLVQHAAPHLRARLFLARNASAESFVAGISPTMALCLIERFLKRNRLAEEDGTPVHFTLEMMRPSVLAEVYRRTGDLLATARFANHVNLETTIRYVIDRLTDDLHDTAIAEVQERLSESILAIRGGGTKLEEADAAPGRRDSIDCANPYRAPGMRIPGEQCPSWLWPLNDPGLVVKDDPEVVVHHVRQLRALETRRNLIPIGRFEKLYGDALRIIRDEILSQLSAQTILAANLLADALPALPVFESD